MANNRRKLSKTKYKCEKCGEKTTKNQVNYRNTGMCYLCYKRINEEAIRHQERCVVCGFNYALHVHHHQGLKHGGKHVLANLIVLCPNHHAMLHLGFYIEECITIYKKSLSRNKRKKKMQHIR